MVDHIGAVFFSGDCVLVQGRNLTHVIEERLCLRASASGGTAGPDEPDELDGPGGERSDAAHWTGVSEAALRTELEELTPLSGVRETTDWCWSSGLVPVLSSLTWAPIAAHLADRYGFHSYSGRTLEVRSGRFTGRVSAAEAADQREFALRRADDLDVSPADCIAVGACSTDGPLLEAVGMSIAFNAPDDLRALASTAVEGDDLRSVIPALRRLTARPR